MQLHNILNFILLIKNTTLPHTYIQNILLENGNKEKRASKINYVHLPKPIGGDEKYSNENLLKLKAEKNLRF